MLDENTTTSVGSEDEIQKYIDTIADMRRTSVSREEYDRVRNENKQLLTSIVSGQAYESGSTEPAPKPDVDALRKDLFGGDCQLTNLEYWQKALTLRQAIIDEGGKDCFLPYGSKIAPTDEDRQKAENVAKVVSECIEYADGDSNIFTTELQRRTVDNIPTRRRR